MVILRTSDRGVTNDACIFRSHYRTASPARPLSPKPPRNEHAYSRSCHTNIFYPGCARSRWRSGSARPREAREQSSTTASYAPTRELFESSPTRRPRAGGRVEGEEGALKNEENGAGKKAVDGGVAAVEGVAGAGGEEGEDQNERDPWSGSRGLLFVMDIYSGCAEWWCRCLSPRCKPVGVAKAV